MVPDLLALSEYSARNCSGRAATGGRLGIPQLRPATLPSEGRPCLAVLRPRCEQADCDKV